MTEDRDLLAELAALLRRAAPVPDDVRAMAAAVLELAFVPPEWTVLQPAQGAAVRAARRSFRFSAGEISVRVDLHGSRLVGIVSPAMEVEVCWPSGSHHVPPEDTGFFILDDVPRGPLRVVAGGRYVTRWFWP